jgi:uncharacterized protein (TIGR00156 family)
MAHCGDPNNRHTAMNFLDSARRLGLVLCLAAAPAAMAQFTGPSPEPRSVTVEQARQTRPDTYVAVTGRIVKHVRDDYFTFKDATGQIRVEIANGVWQNRKVGPETKVRLLAEVDRSAAGPYLSVKSLDIVQ